MGYGEIGSLLPGAAAYGSKRDYTQAAKTEALKRASYLSQMDSFYAQLEESSRQFDARLGFEREQFATEAELARDSLEWNKVMGRHKMDLEDRQLDLQEDLGWEELGLKRDIFDFQQEVNQRDYRGEQDILRQVLPRSLENMDLINESWRQRNNPFGRDSGAGGLNENTYAYGGGDEFQAGGGGTVTNHGTGMTDTWGDGEFISREFDWMQDDASKFF
jgi:hypothetical protein